MCKAVFLDRDGTLISYLPYLHRPEDVEILPGADQGLRLLRSEGYRLIIITNQAGIAHQYFDEAAVETVHQRMFQLFSLRGCSFDAVYYCPHHPEGKNLAYRRSCSCRKPEIGLLEKAASQFGLNLKLCYMVGDNASDVKTGENAGGIGCLVLSGIGSGEFHCTTGLRLAFPSLLAAARWITKRRGSSGEDSD